MGLRNLYFGRLVVIKPFWNHKINDFDFKALDPRKVRFSKFAKKEEESEFAIEEVTDTALAICYRFPSKKEEFLKELGVKEESELYITNKDITYYECWIGDYIICKYQDIILSKEKNPYFDWDGMLMTKEEYARVEQLDGDARRNEMNQIRAQQPSRSSTGQIEPNEGHSEDISYEAYYFNYFDQPRKPYIFATIYNNEDGPIGRTDMITLASSLQYSVNKRKQDIDENCDLVNGIIKIDSTVMDKSDAQALRFQARGIIWGKNVINGVQREVGTPLPPMVFEEMQDSRNEIDSIMAATSAFRGVREGQETKAGRLALIDQSFQQLNEMVQVVDYVSGECFAWAYQLAKTRYTEDHYAKWIGQDGANQIITMSQDDFQTGTELQVIPGKTLPQDAQFRFERAQQDVAAGIISPPDYLEEAGYQNPKQLAQNAVLYQQNPMAAVGLDQAQMPPAQQPGQPTPEQQGQQFEAQMLEQQIAQQMNPQVQQL